MNAILFVAPNWVGDAVFFLPAVDALRRRYPTARFGLLARPGVCALLKEGGRFQDLHPVGPGGRWARFKAQWALRSHAYDAALVFPDSFSSALGAWIGGAKQRVGRGGQGRGFLLTGLRLPPRDRGRHVAEEYLDLARALGAESEPADLRPRLALSQDGIEEKNRLYRESKVGDGLLVALCPTSAYGPAKRWTPAGWSQLAKRLRDERYQPVFFCAPDELLEVAPLADGLPVLTPTLAGLAAALAGAAVVVANDSGPLHLGAAAGARLVGIYGPVAPAWSAPLSSRAELLYTAESCSPCYARVCPLGHHACMRNIEMERVLRAVTEVLKR